MLAYSNAAVCSFCRHWIENLLQMQIENKYYFYCVGGFKRLQQATKGLVTETLVQFCPRAESPSMRKKMVKKFGRKLVSF